MADPATISLIGVGAVAISEGIKFLYGQAGELLKRWRERRDKQAEGGATSGDSATEAVNVVLPGGIFVGQLENPRIHFDALNASAKQLGTLRQELMPYIEGIEDLDSNSPDLHTRLDLLRRLVESIYGQTITFNGESRPPSGTVISANIEVGKLDGDAAGVRTREITSGARI